MTEISLTANRTKSSLMGLEELDQFTTQKEFTRCGMCENNCALTVTIFNDGSKFVTGNRCERGAEKVTKIKFNRSNQKENLVDYKYKNSLNLKHSQNVTLSTVSLEFHVCSTCTKITHFGTRSLLT